MRALVLGGGYAGVTLARKLERRLDDDHELIVVDDDGRHVLQHELHRVVRRPALADEIAMEIGEVLEEASVRVGEVDEVDVEKRTVALADGEHLEFDVCAVAIGATPMLDVEGVADHGIPLKRLDHARRIHERASELLATGGGHVVVGGAGLSGVQVAGELAALAAGADAGTDSDVDTDAETDADTDAEADAGAGDHASTLQVTLLEQENGVAPGFEAPFRAAIRAALEEREIAVRTSTTVERATADAVELERGGSIRHDLLVWTGGITGQDAFQGDRPVVGDRLQLGERTFGLGDAVRAIDRDGEAVPATAQAAVRQAETVATNVERVLEGGDTFDPRLERFAFDPPGWVVSVGDGAVAQVGPTVVTGKAAVALKTSVGVGYLSSVGALREAVDLVNQELGLAVGKD